MIRSTCQVYLRPEDTHYQVDLTGTAEKFHLSGLPDGEPLAFG
jgi:hypothetical protein